MKHYQSKIMLFHLVQQMSREGKSINWISEHFGISWRTTKKYINQSVDEFEHELEHPTPRKKHLDSYQSFVRDKLTHYPEISSAQMHDWLKEHHREFPQVSPKTVFNFVQSVRIRFNISKPENKRAEMLHDACLAWLHRTANEMVHNTTRLIPNDDHRLNERQQLQPWHSIAFEPRSETLIYSVHKDNKISYKGNFYTLPTGTYKDENSMVKLVLNKGELVILTEEGKKI